MSLPVFPSTIRGLGYTVVKGSGFNTIVQSSPNNLEMTVSQARNPRWTWQYIYNYAKDFDVQSGQNYTDYRILQGFLLSLAGAGGEFLFTDPTDNYVGPAVTSGTTPNPLAELQLITDGVGNWYSPIQRNFGGQFYEDITDLNGYISLYANGVLKSEYPRYSGGDFILQGPGVAFAGYSFMGLVAQWINHGIGTWSNLNPYAVGVKILDPAGHVQEVTTAGTPGSTEPTWNDSGGTTTDGSVVWTDQGYNPSPVTAPITAQFNFYFRCRIASDEAQIDQFMQYIWTYGGPDSQSGEPLSFKTSPPVQV